MTLERESQVSICFCLSLLSLFAVLFVTLIIANIFWALFAVEDALADPYFKMMHNINNEPVCTKLFDFDFEENPLTLEQIKELIYLEALDFNPESVAPIPEPATVENGQ